MNPEAKKVILLVDDMPANIQIVNSILQDNYRVRIATSGARALDLVRTEPIPDLILLDVLMPEMDGFEVCARLKADPATREIPVIFLTGRTEVEDETKGFEIGGVDYIHKPFSHAVVQARVQTHLTLRGIRDQLSRQLSALKEELESAHQIQRSILPREAPPVTGLEIAMRYIPMNAVAGDFYDFIVVDEHHVGVLVADVSGHGMPAALISSMLKIALAEQSDYATQPARLLTRLNQVLCGKFRHRFITAAYVYLDTENNSLRYSGAGHPPMLLRRYLSGDVEEVVENGLFLGAFPDAAYTEIELPFEPGDWIVLYTDGVFETENPAQKEYGTDRFKDFLSTHADRSPSDFAIALLEDLTRWAEGKETEDDLTLLAIRFNPQPPS
jgi:phosphoserine phosphatase RsbU/P